MKLLIQFPTRERPYRFMEYLNRYVGLIVDWKNTNFHISLDSDDKTMKNEKMIFNLKALGCGYSFNDNKTKHEAVNKGLNEREWDICLLASDDMWPEKFGYDDIIRKNMEECFPDTDGALWYYDGNRKDLNTLQILGRKYFNRFGYIYREEYKAFYGDTEFQEVAEGLDKLRYIDHCIIRHKHYSVTGEAMDKTYHKNDVFALHDDKAFAKRKAAGFPIG